MRLLIIRNLFLFFNTSNNKTKKTTFNFYNHSKIHPMIVKEIVCELLIAIHVILFIQSRREKYNVEK
jgi:formate/nitrite transporter FocA (FNT family)